MFLLAVLLISYACFVLFYFVLSLLLSLCVVTILTMLLPLLSYLRCGISMSAFIFCACSIFLSCKALMFDDIIIMLLLLVVVVI